MIDLPAESPFLCPMRLTHTLGFLSLGLFLPACFAPKIDGAVRMIEFTPEGDIGISTTGVTATNSLEGLGLNDEERIPGAMVDFQWGGPHISVSTQQGDWSGTGTLNAEFSDGTVTIPVGTAVNSELDLAIHGAVITWDFLPGNAELGIGFGVNALDFQGSFESQSTMDRIDFDEMLPIPSIAVRANVQVGAFEVGGHASGFEIDYDGDEAFFLDMDVNARYHFIGGNSRASGSVMLGYRALQLEVDYTDDSGERVDMDLDFSGPFIGAQLSF